jgi:5'-nucleotidase
MIRPIRSFAGVLAALLTLAGCATIQTAPVTPVTVRIVGINDFHGNLEPIQRALTLDDGKGGKSQVYAGGAAWFASAVAAVRAENPDSMVISAGDLVSASPLASSLFLDEPSIGVMNRVGVDFNAVGNHEFDRGWHELRRIQGGGCEKYTLRTPCAVEPNYKGANFPFLAANVKMSDGSTLFPAYGIKRFGAGREAVAVGVIGLTLKETPLIVTPSGVEGLTFTDEAEAINAAVPKLLAEGADAIVVAIHQGLVPEEGASFTGCGAMAGGLRDILDKIDPRVDLVISGHTHRAYICDFAKVDPSRHFLVTSAGYGGTLITDIGLTIDPAANRVTAVTARNVPVQSAGEGRPANPAFATYAPDPRVAAYVARYVAAAHDASARPIGKLSGKALRGGAESPLGDLIADSQFAATRGAGAQVAFMNPGGVRADLIPSGADGTVTFGDIYAVQPFGNTLTTLTLTGAQILDLLEQQFANPDEVNILMASSNFHMTLDPKRAAGQRVVAAMLDGKPIDPAASYRVTVNNFMANGGDGFATLTKATDATVGPLDLDALEAYIAAVPVRQVPDVGRVTIVGG